VPGSPRHAQERPRKAHQASNPPIISSAICSWLAQLACICIAPLCPRRPWQLSSAHQPVPAMPGGYPVSRPTLSSFSIQCFKPHLVSARTEVSEVLLSVRACWSLVADRQPFSITLRRGGGLGFGLLATGFFHDCAIQSLAPSYSSRTSSLLHRL
jgi:hypothetical protein